MDSSVDSISVQNATMLRSQKQAKNKADVEANTYAHAHTTDELGASGSAQPRTEFAQRTHNVTMQAIASVKKDAAELKHEKELEAEEHKKHHQSEYVRKVVNAPPYTLILDVSMITKEVRVVDRLFDGLSLGSSDKPPDGSDPMIGDGTLKQPGFR